jgi:hypothetical protein
MRRLQIYCVINTQEVAMITKARTGDYEIVETKYRTKVLYLDSDAFAWIRPKNIGEILVSSHHLQDSDIKVSRGAYILYDVDDEDYLTDLQHLELEYGHGAWQGYLLPTGLPREGKTRSRIIPTNQIITNMPFFKKHVVAPRPKALATATGA